MSDPEEFEVIDKRKVKADAQAATDEAPAAAPSEAGSSGAGQNPSPGWDAGEESDDEDDNPFGAGFQKLTGEDGEFRLPPELLAPDLSFFLATTVQALSLQAWWRMGVTANPATGQIDRDMAKAKLAIDCAQFLADKVAPYLPEDQARDLRHLISNLQINFVEQSRMG